MVLHGACVTTVDRVKTDTRTQGYINSIQRNFPVMLTNWNKNMAASIIVKK